MNLSPETLQEETEAERVEREGVSGVLGTGHLVQCFPDLTDPNVTEKKHRAVCLTKPLEACGTCPHSTFTLAFNSNIKRDRFHIVSCPRWATEQERIEGQAPEHYVLTEEATCAAKPFLFCPSCPSRDALGNCGVDKTKSGWFGRWNRLKESEDDPG